MTNEQTAEVNCAEDFIVSLQRRINTLAWERRELELIRDKEVAKLADYIARIKAGA